MTVPKAVRAESITQKPSIHRNALTGDVSRRGQAQEGDGGSDLFGFADAAHRRAQQHFVQVVGVGEFFRGAAGADVPGSDGVDAHAVLGPFAGEVAGHLVHRGLRSEEHTSEIQSLMRTSSATYCLKKKTKIQHITS